MGIENIFTNQIFRLIKEADKDALQALNRSGLLTELLSLSAEKISQINRERFRETIGLDEKEPRIYRFLIRTPLFSSQELTDLVEKEIKIELGPRANVINWHVEEDIEEIVLKRNPETKNHEATIQNVKVIVVEYTD